LRAPLFSFSRPSGRKLPISARASCRRHSASKTRVNALTGERPAREVHSGRAGSFSKTPVGWNVGGGLEYAFLNNWSAKLEYLYVDLGTATCGAGCSTTNPFDVTFSTQIVRRGLNCKF
jgi:opacity protein-like surface antigen